MKLTILFGIPAAGKSTWAEKHSDGAVVVSRDDLRDTTRPQMRSGRRWEWTPEFEQRVLAEYRAQVAGALAGGKSVIADATNLLQGDRTFLIALALRYGAETRLVHFTDARAAVERNRCRPKTERVPLRSVVPLLVRYIEALDDIENETYDEVLEVR